MKMKIINFKSNLEDLNSKIKYTEDIFDFFHYGLDDAAIHIFYNSTEAFPAIFDCHIILFRVIKTSARSKFLNSKGNLEWRFRTSRKIFLPWKRKSISMGNPIGEIHLKFSGITSTSIFFISSSLNISTKTDVYFTCRSTTKAVSREIFLSLGVYIIGNLKNEN